MLPKDKDTWTQFLEREIIIFEELWYDVHVGRPMVVPKGSPEYMIKVVSGVSRKRIDVVGSTDVELYIIEVKPHANMESVGQIVTYKRLFENEFAVTRMLKAMIVCKTADADILEIMEINGVQLVAMEGVLL